MAKRHIEPEDLAGKVIDIHSHLGVCMKAYASMEFPYAQSVEDLYYRQVSAGVDVNVVFPFSADLFFDLRELMQGNTVPAAQPFSNAPFAAENLMLFHEIFRFCPEHQQRFIPFVSIDPERKVAEQLAALHSLEEQFPIYGIKVLPVSCQKRITKLLDEGEPLLDFARQRNLPFLFHTTVDPNETYSHARYAFEVIERNPDLRFCLAHCIGFHKDYLKRAGTMNNVWVDTSGLAIQVELAAANSPLMAPARDRFPADYSDHLRVMQSLAEAYPDTILWGTDSPAYTYFAHRRQAEGEGEGAFVDFGLKATYEDEKAALDVLPDALRRATCNANAIRFLFGRPAPSV